MTSIAIVNASSVLTDAEVASVVPVLQKWDDEMLRPAWGFDACTYGFVSWREFSPEQDGIWPIFINRHSLDPGVGGYHDDETGKIFGRVFVGDALRYGISWTVDLSHEAAEIRGNPTIRQVVRLPSSLWALRELCDPVEADELAIEVDDVKFSDFVLPSYFDGGSGPWDYQQRLAGPCPHLTPGGYQSLSDGQSWTQVTAMYLGGPISYRAQRHRRLKLSAGRASPTP